MKYIAGESIPAEATIEESSISNGMVIKNCTRAHSGIYTIIAKNAAGEKRFDINVLVQGKIHSLKKTI